MQFNIFLAINCKLNENSHMLRLFNSRRLISNQDV